MPLTYNVATTVASFLAGAKPKAMRETMSGIGSPSILACHQSLSKGGLLSPSLAKAKLRKHPPRGWAVASMLTPSHIRAAVPWRGASCPDRTSLHLTQTTGCSDSRSDGSALKLLLFSSLITRKQQCHHMKSLVEETLILLLQWADAAPRSGPSFVNDFKVVVSREITGISNCILM